MIFQKFTATESSIKQGFLSKYRQKASTPELVQWLAFPFIVVVSMPDFNRESWVRFLQWEIQVQVLGAGLIFFLPGTVLTF